MTPEIDRSERLLAIIHLQTEIAASDLDLHSAMELIAERAKTLTGASGAVIAMADGDDEMVFRHASGEATPYLGERLQISSSLSGLAFRQKAVLLCDDTSRESRVNRELCQRVGARSLLCVPLNHRDKTVGTVTVYSSELAAFEAEDVRALELLSGLIGAHLSHASLFASQAHDSRHDALTGLLNRRAYEECLMIEAARAERHGHALSLCLLDVDDFKAINDSRGHPAGDNALRQVAIAIRRSRAADDGFRIGGDEFAILMPETSRRQAEEATSRLVASIVSEPSAPGFGVSYGIAAEAVDPTALHAAADRALLAAKDRLYGRGLHENQTGAGSS